MKYTICSWMMVCCLTMGSVATVAVAPAAAQTVYTFTGGGEDTGVWGSPSNWTPGGGPPIAGDTAIIPAGKTCLIQNANRAAAVIDVRRDGTTLGVLKILDTKELTLSDDSTIDGKLVFEDSGEAAGPGVLKISDHLTIEGDGGVIEAGTTGNLNQGNIGFVTTVKDLTLTTVSGTTLILRNVGAIGPYLVNNVKFETSDSGVTTSINHGPRGTGDFDVTAGTLRFLSTSVPAGSGTIRMDGSGAVIDFEGDEHPCNAYKLELIRGTFQAGEMFCTSGTYELGGHEDHDLTIVTPALTQRGVAAGYDCSTFFGPCEE